MTHAAIRNVAAGDSLLSPTATRALIVRVLAQPNIALARAPAALAGLTPREREILTLSSTAVRAARRSSRKPGPRNVNCRAE